ncbi:MarR family transcriptional regulator [uncultured Novosphingobium sp.]|uniref:LexA family protein n=1 Tax=uncultured Novosphingobium sp. TaxID=292277 RepID=UPI0025946BFF|nr:MarR family transcriptional regulator [uncultured Novosphingobium sp.]
MIALTTQQSRLLSYLKSYLASTGGVAPSVREIVQALGLGSKSAAHRLLTKLEERGHVRRIPYRARAIEVVDIGPLHSVATADLVAELARRGITVLQPDQEVSQALLVDGRP